MVISNKDMPTRWNLCWGRLVQILGGFKGFGIDLSNSKGITKSLIFHVEDVLINCRELYIGTMYLYKLRLLKLVFLKNTLAYK